MERNNDKETKMNRPIEQHDTAAWANIGKEKRVSKVTVPSKMQTENAKKHVDTNEK